MIEFDRFRVIPYRRELLADGQPVEIGARAFDVLMALINAGGGVLTKDELMRQVWPGRIVEENSLHAQISILRRALGAERDLVRTVPGRGYHLAARLQGSPEDPASFRVPTNLPDPVSTLVCRDSVIRDVADLVASRRLVTLTGAGGIGKTRLGIEVARQFLSRLADGAWIAELGLLSNPALVTAAVATALNVTLTKTQGARERFAAALGSRQLLIMLDNCEHLVEAAARVVEDLVRAGPGVTVLVTSREPLRIDGECVYQVPPLDVPGEGETEPEQWKLAGAVKLFIDRARAANHDFAPDAANLAVITTLCRRLDGIPLAIEMAAARVATIGVEAVASRLHRRFELLTDGLRTALPQHQTMHATLDWSHELLTEAERRLFRRLAVFPCGFTLESASTVVADPKLSSSDVLELVAHLACKSLVMTDAPGFRMLETTRAYAVEKLVESGELDRLSRAHGQHLLAVFEQATSALEAAQSPERLAPLRFAIANLPGVLDWAFSSHGDASIGVRLTAASAPFWHQLSAVKE